MSNKPLIKVKGKVQDLHKKEKTLNLNPVRFYSHSTPINSLKKMTHT